MSMAGKDGPSRPLSWNGAHTMNIPDVSTLHAENIDDKPQDFNFDPEEMDHTWEIIYPDPHYWPFEQCQAWMLDRGMDEVPSQSEYDEDPDEVLVDMRDRIETEMYESDDYTPIMSHIYPIHLNYDEQTAQAQLDDLPVVLVNVRIDGYSGHVPYLALSGGGMDLSWEICEAYIRLGQLPPVHFCNLPRMAGRGESEQDRQIIRACLESLLIRKRRTEREIEDFMRTHDRKG